MPAYQSGFTPTDMPTRTYVRVSSVRVSSTWPGSGPAAVGCGSTATAVGELARFGPLADAVDLGRRLIAVSVGAG
jgi:hypothetical protein